MRRTTRAWRTDRARHAAQVRWAAREIEAVQAAEADDFVPDPNAARGAQ